MVKKIVITFGKLLSILNCNQKILGIIVLICSLVAALLETLGVSIIVPLVNVLLQPKQLYKNEWIKNITDVLGIHQDEQLIILVVLVVVAVYIFKNAFFVFFCWLKSKYACKIQRECAVYMMQSYMNRGYRFFLNKNVNELMQGVNGDVQSLYQIITGLLQIVSQMMISLCICVYMCYSDYQIALGIILSAVLCLSLIFVLFRKRMLDAGKAFRIYSINASRTLLQAFHGIKEVLVLRKQKFFINEFEENINKKQNMQIRQNIGAEMPTYLIEGICISGIMLILCIKILNISEPEVFVATLASFAVGAFRILPALGKISISINSISSSMPGFNAVYENIIEARKYNNIFFDVNIKDEWQFCDKKFEKSIELKNLSFTYEKTQREVLTDINLVIQKGKSIAFVGESGSGKSTLADLILGVLIPDKGEILLDNVNIRSIPNIWSKLIGYVPQNIYLSDGSIYENVAFGIQKEKIDEERVKSALEKAEMLRFVEELPEGIFTQVGDRGIRLSGGQKQRIGIARALYHNPEILILDEATSALDNDTEKSVMKAIDMLHGTMTLIIIAHRLTTIKNCDMVYEVKNGNIIERNYDELIK